MTASVFSRRTRRIPAYCRGPSDLDAGTSARFPISPAPLERRFLVQPHSYRRQRCLAVRLGPIEGSARPNGSEARLLEFQAVGLLRLHARPKNAASTAMIDDRWSLSLVSAGMESRLKAPERWHSGKGGQEDS